MKAELIANFIDIQTQMLKKNVEFSIIEIFDNKLSSWIKQYLQHSLKNESNNVQTTTFSTNEKKIVSTSKNNNTLYATSKKNNNQIMQILLEKKSMSTFKIKDITTHCKRRQLKIIIK